MEYFDCRRNKAKNYTNRIIIKMDNTFLFPHFINRYYDLDNKATILIINMNQLEKSKKNKEEDKECYDYFKFFSLNKSEQLQFMKMHKLKSIFEGYLNQQIKEVIIDEKCTDKIYNFN